MLALPVRSRILACAQHLLKHAHSLVDIAALELQLRQLLPHRLQLGVRLREQRTFGHRQERFLELAVHIRFQLSRPRLERHRRRRPRRFQLQSKSHRLRLQRLPRTLLRGLDDIFELLGNAAREHLERAVHAAGKCIEFHIAQFVAVHR